MSNHHVYQRLATEKNITVNRLETVLGVANGTIRKAIERNSSLSADMIEKIVSTYPDITRDWLAGSNKKAPETGAEMDTVKALTIALEAKEQARAATEEAKEAYKVVAELERELRQKEKATVSGSPGISPIEVAKAAGLREYVVGLGMEIRKESKEKESAHLHSLQSQWMDRIKKGKLVGEGI